MYVYVCPICFEYSFRMTQFYFVHIQKVNEIFPEVIAFLHEIYKICCFWRRRILIAAHKMEYTATQL